MNIALIFAIICGVFVTSILLLALWLILTGLKAARQNDRLIAGRSECKDNPEE